MSTAEAIHELVNAAWRFYGGKGEVDSIVLRGKVEAEKQKEEVD
jgi:hypothetical protein